jgi:dTDP-D-glucose 4,6-dehydratase
MPSSPFSTRKIASNFCSKVILAIKKAPPNVRFVSNNWGAVQNKESVFMILMIPPPYIQSTSPLEKLS